MMYVEMCVTVNRGNISSRFCSNSEALASEFPENISSILSHWKMSIIRVKHSSRISRNSYKNISSINRSG